MTFFLTQNLWYFIFWHFRLKSLKCDVLIKNIFSTWLKDMKAKSKYLTSSKNIHEAVFGKGLRRGMLDRIQKVDPYYTKYLTWQLMMTRRLVRGIGVSVENELIKNSDWFFGLKKFWIRKISNENKCRQNYLSRQFWPISGVARSNAKGQKWRRGCVFYIHLAPSIRFLVRGRIE